MKYRVQLQTAINLLKQDKDKMPENMETHNSALSDTEEIEQVMNLPSTPAPRQYGKWPVIYKLPQFHPALQDALDEKKH